MINEYDWERLKGLGFDLDYIEKATGDLKEACWKGYTAVGMKKKGGRMVPNCVPIDKKHSENPLDDMVPGELPKEPIPGGGDLKTPQMAEPQMRMPRSDELKKANRNNGQLARMASNGSGDGGYSEHSEDAFQSTEPNGGMLLTQLKVAREKIDMLLTMMEPEDNFEPWVATKIANAGVAMTSVADYLRFGGET
jgi:hypothetical protein